MNIEVLKGVLSQGTYDLVSAETKDADGNLVDLSGGAYIDKRKYTALEDQLKSANTLLSTRETELSELREKAIQLQDLQTKHEAENQQRQQEWESKLKKVNVENYIISKFAPNDVCDIMPHINMDQITVEADKVTGGVDEQIEALKKSHSYYFRSSGRKVEGLEHGGSNLGNEDAFLKGFKS